MSSKERQAALTEAFGAHASAAEEALDLQAKADFDAYKYKVQQLKPAFAKRNELAKKVPKFWVKAMNNCSLLTPYIDAVDNDALEHLQEVVIDHEDEDPRNYTITFKFSSKNPFFKETSLSKKLSVKPTDGKPEPSPYDLDCDVYGSATTITWTSDEHNLLKKAPKTDPSKLEEFDEFDTFGSIFNWFVESGHDDYGLAESILEWNAHAIEYAAGLVERDMVDSEDEDEDEEDDDSDLNKEIDLESEDEKPQKKKQKRS